ncbi:hypothetical protein T484DRAFT_1871085 [Baffinella frigidus]|nr:hypothetical protein T484DRAFT_1871085 [Cryptophyta sp. CCMP2293]
MQRELMMVREGACGKASTTIARVRERFGDFTLVELELLTGRCKDVHESERESAAWDVSAPAFVMKLDVQVCV